MLYRYSWCKVPNEPAEILRVLAEADVEFRLEDGLVVLKEQHVPLIDLAIRMSKWLRCGGILDYSPDGYLHNPLFLLQYADGGGKIQLSTPDTRSFKCPVEIEVEEARTFCRNLVNDVTSDLEGRNDVINLIGL
jgi:hypothetical protein